MDYRERFEIKDYRNEQMLGGRIGLLHAAVIVLLASFAMNFWYLQVVRGEHYAVLAENNRLRKVVLRPTRGMIRDREEAPGKTSILRSPAIPRGAERDHAFRLLSLPPADRRWMRTVRFGRKKLVRGPR